MYVCTLCKRTKTSFVELLETCLCLSHAVGRVPYTTHIMWIWENIPEGLTLLLALPPNAGAAEVMEWVMKIEKETARFDVYTAVLLKIPVLWDIRLCR
jgi:hypothetical protein